MQQVDMNLFGLSPEFADTYKYMASMGKILYLSLSIFLCIFCLSVSFDRVAIVSWDPDDKFTLT
jgi:hypothetical protein